jgi:hypothetical protein
VPGGEWRLEGWASAQPFVAKVQWGVCLCQVLVLTVWSRRAGRYPRMNRSPSTTDLTCPTDGVILWWLSLKAGADSIDGSNFNGVWWCHRCEKSFAEEGVKQIESGRRYPLHIV